MRVYDVTEEALASPDMAVVGMAARFPGAPDIFQYWKNLHGAVESILPLSESDLRAAGVDSAALHDPNYVRRAAILDRMEQFDARFFGFSKREASVLDPQHRHFLEVCYEALESAGVVPESFGGAIGVFGGSGMNAYLPYNLFTNPDLMNSMGLFLARHTGNDKDFLTTRVSYCLNLTGPSVNVQTACSTSLVAIHLACQSLLSRECDAALAGGVTIELPHYRGYRFEEGEILSPDGQCRPFEARSKGTVFGSGAGVVLIKRLKDAVEQGDHIHAIIKGSAINNDGSRKVGYLAPSVPGQAQCVVEALQVADLSARDISYVECHGTGTPVGDPIEVAALTQAFSRWTTDKGFCGIGSVKSNIGHLDTAAGVASFIKVVQMLEAEELVPTLHFEKPNPEIDFASTPFWVAGEARPWRRTERPRRAGVSSLGVGGTNAHIIIEEAPRRLPVKAAAEPEAENHLLLLSARSPASLDAASQRLARHLEETPGVSLADVSSTLLHGRRRFPFRRVIAAASLDEARTLLQQPDPSGVFDVRDAAESAPVLFMFAGGGAQHAGMAQQVYKAEPVFRASLDQSLEILTRIEKLELRPLLFPAEGQEPAASLTLEQRPSLGLPALLAVEIAYARVLESWGIVPTAMIGHSLGEYAAAHLAGVLTLEAALGIMSCRGRLFETVKKGGMLSVPMAADKLQPLLDAGVSIAAVNAPELCVVSGEHASLDALEKVLAAREVEARRLRIDVPAHSPLLEPILAEFGAYLAKIKFSPLKRPFISNLSGAFITDKELNAAYFVRHLRETVRFSDGLKALFEAHPQAVLVEVGPGQGLTAVARLHTARRPEHALVPLAPHLKDPTRHARFLKASAGRILAHGGQVDLPALLRKRPRRIVPLPPTPFEHERHWIEPGKGYFMSPAASEESSREDDVGRWFYKPVFREEPLPPADVAAGEKWLILAEGQLASSLQLEGRARGATCVVVTPGERTQRLGPDRFTLALSDPEGYDEVVQQIIADGGIPRRILHALALGPAALDPEAAPTPEVLDRCFHSLMYLAQAFGQEDLGTGIELVVATARAYDVVAGETLRPLHALVQGPVLVIPRELVELKARLIDLLDPTDPEATARLLLDELSTPWTHGLVAQRGARRHVGVLERITLETPAPVALPERPVVLLTGGLGGIARTLARHLAGSRQARVVLVSRSKLPPSSQWASARSAADAGSMAAEQLDDLLALQAMGAEVMVEQADVSSAKDATALVKRVREHFGRIDMVVHAAGVLDDGPLALKDRASVEAVLAPKVAGSHHLLEALGSQPPAFVLLLSSTSAVLGPPGQIDYVAANAYVAALARALSRRLSGTRVVSLGFGVWKGTGMAARALRPFSPPLHGEPTGHPLVERRQRTEAGTVEYEAVYDTAKLWVLDEHRVRGHGAVLPGTAMVEIMRAAGAGALEARPGQALAISDVAFVAPVEVPDGEPRLVRTIVSREEPDDTAWQVLLVSRGRDEKTDVEHARGNVQLLEGPAPAPLDLRAITARCNVRNAEFEEGRQLLPQDQHLAFGPRWLVLRSMRFGETEGLAHLSLPQKFAADLDTFHLHPGLLDIASGFAFSLADPTGTSERVRVPLSYQHLRMYAPLQQTMVSHVRLRQANAQDGIAVFDVTLADPTGKVLLQVEGYTTRSIAPTTLARQPRAAKEPSLLERWSRQGITQTEGVEVVERLLGFAVPPDLLASPTSLYTMLERLAPPPPAARSTAAGTAGTGAEADNAPRDDIERRLAEMWSGLLGVESAGIRDNFFDLGGHSLIAVRLFARIKKTYGVDLPLAVLFQAPTIESCATILRKELGITLAIDASPAAAGGPARSAVIERSYAHLVQIQDGPGIPFYCVHGAGGNVLNFRELAKSLGRQQPFFGLQALGVNGEQPARTVEEMADLYLRDILDARPQGPYLLGGYSGGGVVAYEMAQRLRAAGHQVPLVAFLDTFHPSTSPRKQTLGERMETLLREGPGGLARRGKSKLQRHLDEMSTELKIQYCASNNLPLPIELREIQMTRAFYAVAQRYRPRPYPGPVTLFRARMMADVYKHMGPTLGWKELIPHLEIFEVPGGHDSLVLEPNVQILAQQLSGAIARATGQTPSTATRGNDQREEQRL